MHLLLLKRRENGNAVPTHLAQRSLVEERRRREFSRKEPDRA